MIFQKKNVKYVVQKFVKNCYGNLDSDICESCLSSFFPLYENNKIKKCEIICETGEGEKCLVCNWTINRCSSCNTVYKLINGKCYLNYSFKAIYSSKNANENIKLINNLPSNINEMIIDGEIVSPSTKYIFNKR